jgi:hypothetical protein
MYLKELMLQKAEGLDKLLKETAISVCQEVQLTPSHTLHDPKRTLRKIP